MNELIGREEHLSTPVYEDLQYSRLRDAIPNTSRTYTTTLKGGESDWDYAGATGIPAYHAAEFDFKADMGCVALTFIIETDAAIDVRLNENDNSIMRINAGTTFSLSRWELIVSKVDIRCATGVSPESDARVNIFISGYIPQTRSTQKQTV